MGRFRLICVVVAAVVTAIVGGSSWWMIHDARHAMAQQVEAAEMLAASERAGAFSESLGRSQYFLHLVASGPGLIQALRTTDLRILGSVQDTMTGADGISGVTFYGPNGAVVVTAGRTPAGMPTDPPRFRTVRDHPEAFVSLGEKVVGAKGEPLGGLRVEFSIAGVSPQLRQPFSRFNGATSLVDRDGQVLLASGAHSTVGAEARALAGALDDERAESTEVDGRIASVAPVRGYDLAVIVSASTKAASGPANRLALRLALVYLLTAVVVTALTLLVFAVLRRTRAELQARHDLLTVQATTDPLTGVANRRALDAAILDLSTQDSTTGVVVLDLDGLKAINDTCGHAVGDDALRRTAQAIRSVVRPTDLVARVGGDEFVVLLPQSDPWRAQDVADRARTAIGTIELPAYGLLSATIGVDASGGTDLLGALERADRHLYQGKQLRQV